MKKQIIIVGIILVIVALVAILYVGLNQTQSYTVELVDTPFGWEGQVWAVQINGEIHYIDDGYFVSSTNNYPWVSGVTKLIGEVGKVVVMEGYMTYTYKALNIEETSYCGKDLDVSCLQEPPSGCGTVNFQDAGLVWIHRTFPITDPPNTYDPIYDMDCDNDVDMFDAQIVWINRD